MLRAAAAGLALLIAAIVMVPWAAPDWTIGSIDDLSVDHAFIVAMPELFLSHAQYGPDVVFTYGPWGFLATNAVPFALLPAVLGFRLCLVVLPLLCVAQRLRRMDPGPAWGAALLLGAAALWSFWATILDQGLWMLPALLVAAEVLAQDPDDRGPWDAALLVALTVVAGWAGLVKFNLLVLAAVVYASLLVLDLRRRRFPLLTFAWLAATLLAWLAAGQAPANLPIWIARSLDLSAGYADAMAKGFTRPYGLATMAWFYGGLACLVASIFVVAWRASARTDPVLVILGVFGAAAYLALQHAISGNQIEQAVGELLGIAWLLALLAACAIQPAQRRHGAGLLLGLSVLCLGAALPGTIFWPYASGELPARAARNAAAAGRMMLGDMTAQRGFWERLMADTRHAMPLPADLHGTADAYPQHTAVVIADPALRYTPRPAYLSLNAHTAGLTAANAAALDRRGPDIVLFQIIDPVRAVNERLPATDDGPSWPVLLANYRPDRLAGEFLILRRRRVPLGTTRTLLVDREIAWGETLSVPALPMLWAELTVGRSLPGRLVQLIYKPPLVRLTLTAASGDAAFQLVPELGAAGFLISPLVTSTAAFASLYRQDDALKDPVSALSVDTEAGLRWFWRPLIHVRLYALGVAQDSDPNPGIDDVLRLQALKLRVESCLAPPSWQSASGETHLVLLVHAPCRTSIPVPPGATGARVRFGLRYVPDPPPAEPPLGADMRFVALGADGSPLAFMTRFLDPARRAEDRGTQQAVLDWPRGSASTLRIVTDPGPGRSPNYDHTYIASIRFLPPDEPP